MTAGADHTCGVKTNGTVACWGDNTFGQATPPAGTFLSVSAGGSHTCAVEANGKPACWGGERQRTALTPQGLLSAVDAGRDFSMGLQKDELVFW